jgi:hydrogenase nickel incorporation protein HypA/HybF
MSVHELGLSEAIVDAVERRAAGRRVAAVRVRVGSAHAMDDRALGEAFRLAAAGTVAEGAEIEIVLDPLRVRCNACGNEVDGGDARLLVACRRCGGVDVEVRGGDDVTLESVGLVGSG